MKKLMMTSPVRRLLLLFTFALAVGTAEYAVFVRLEKIKRRNAEVRALLDRSRKRCDELTRSAELMEEDEKQLRQLNIVFAQDLSQLQLSLEETAKSHNIAATVVCTAHDIISGKAQFQISLILTSGQCLSFLRTLMGQREVLIVQSINLRGLDDGSVEVQMDVSGFVEEGGRERAK